MDSRSHQTAPGPLEGHHLAKPGETKRPMVEHYDDEERERDERALTYLVTLRHVCTIILPPGHQVLTHIIEFGIIPKIRAVGAGRSME